MDNKTALPEAAKTVVDAILNSGIPGLRTAEKELRRSAEQLDPDFVIGGFYAQWELGFGVNATLNVDFRAECAGAQGFKVTPELSWSTTSYDLATAKKAATLHAAVINLAEVIALRTEKYAPKAGK